MEIKLDGGLNLGDPGALGDNELSIALNADFRQDGVVRSRDVRVSLYESVSSSKLMVANGDVYSSDTDVYKNGVSVSANLSNVQALGKMALPAQSTESVFYAGSSNQKVEDDGTVSLWGLAAPTIAPTLVLGSSTGLTGDYYFKYSYMRKVGTTLVAESNPSPVSLIIATVDQDVEVNITPSNDSQVTHIRVYRTLANPGAGSTDFFYQDIDIVLPLASGTSSGLDSTLGGLVDTINDVPPSDITAIGGPGTYNRLFVGVGNKLYFSRKLKPESFPALYYIEVGTPHNTIQSIVDWGGFVFIFTKDGIYALQGSSADTFHANRTLATHGLAAKSAITPTEKGILYLSYDGIYLFNGNTEQKITEKVDALFRGKIVNGINPLNADYISTCWLAYYNTKIFVGYPDGNHVVPNKVLVFDLDKAKYSIYDYGTGLLCAFVDGANKRLLLGGNNNTVYVADGGGDDNTDDIFRFRIRSKEFSKVTKVSPIYLRYDITNEFSNTLSAKVLSKGVTLHTHSLTSSENMRRRFVEQEQYEKLSVEIEGFIDRRIEIGGVDVQ